MYWLDNTRIDIKASDKEKVVILPVGSCEQHGSHLPVGTDTFIGEKILESISETLQQEVMILPYIWFGFSKHHMDFEGTLTINSQTLVNLVVELCESIYKSHFCKVILFNSHGGNMPALQVAVNEIGVRNGKAPALLSYWNLLNKDIDNMRKSRLGGIGHAGELETSLIMYLFSRDIVVAEDDASYTSNPYYTYDMFASKLYFKYKTFSRISSKGLVGDPRLATKDEGEQLFRLILAKFTEFILYYRKNEL